MRRTVAPGLGSPGSSGRVALMPASCRCAKRRWRALRQTPGQTAGSSPPATPAIPGSGSSDRRTAWRGCAGMLASRSAIEPPMNRGAAHSGSGLGHQWASTPTWMKASATSASNVSTTSTSKARASRWRHEDRQQGEDDRHAVRPPLQQTERAGRQADPVLDGQRGGQRGPGAERGDQGKRAERQGRHARGCALRRRGAQVAAGAPKAYGPPPRQYGRKQCAASSGAAPRRAM